MPELKFNRPLLTHQADTFARFASLPQMALFHEMGCGKTTTAITWLRWKYKLHASIPRTLIISPVATLYNWQEEFKINAHENIFKSVFVPYMKTKKTKYTGEERARQISAATGAICILNPESLDSDDVMAALKLWVTQIVVVDESHKFKSPNMLAKNSKKRTPSRLAKLLSISDKAQYRCIMTGTPILNSYLDLWAQFRILDGGLTLGGNYFTFRETYFTDENIRWKGKPKYFPHYVPKPGIDAALSNKISIKSSRMTKDQCLDLPPLVKVKHHVELSPAQLKAYSSMEEELIAEVNGGTCAATNALVRVNRMLQVLSGYLPVEYEDESKGVEYFKGNPRLEALRELLEELTPHHKVIVWAGFRANYASIRALLSDIFGVNPPSPFWVELTGETKNRQEQIDWFQNETKCRVMLANAAAGGVGVNLTAASYSIYYSRTYSLGDRLQSEARNHRKGSEVHEKVTLIDLVARDTLDEDVLTALVRKESFADNVLDRLKHRV